MSRLPSETKAGLQAALTMSYAAAPAPLIGLPLMRPRLPPAATPRLMRPKRRVEHRAIRGAA